MRIRSAESELAERLVAELSSGKFAPEQYHDHYRERLKEVVERKVFNPEKVY